MKVVLKQLDNIMEFGPHEPSLWSAPYLPFFYMQGMGLMQELSYIWGISIRKHLHMSKTKSILKNLSPKILAAFDSIDLLEREWFLQQSGAYFSF